MGKAYWAKSMVVARATGVPYRQNDLVLTSKNGRVLIRSSAVGALGLTEDSFCWLQMNSDGRMLMHVMEDKEGLLRQHAKRVQGQENMMFHARQQVRMMCQKYKTDMLRCAIKSVAEVSEKETVAVLERVDDLAEMYGWGSRRKGEK